MSNRYTWEYRVRPQADTSWQVVEIFGARKKRETVVFTGSSEYQAHAVAQALVHYRWHDRPSGPIQESYPLSAHVRAAAAGPGRAVGRRAISTVQWPPSQLSLLLSALVGTGDLKQPMAKAILAVAEGEAVRNAVPRAGSGSVSQVVRPDAAARLDPGDFVYEGTSGVALACHRLPPAVVTRLRAEEKITAITSPAEARPPRRARLALVR